MNESEHSPTPWKEDEYYPQHIIDISGKEVAFVGGERTTSEIDAGNLQIILRAVNSYAALIEACKSAFEELNEVYGGHETDEMQKIRAALALSEEQNEPLTKPTETAEEAAWRVFSSTAPNANQDSFLQGWRAAKEGK